MQVSPGLYENLDSYPNFPVCGKYVNYRRRRVSSSRHICALPVGYPTDAAVWACATPAGPRTTLRMIKKVFIFRIVSLLQDEKSRTAIGGQQCGVRCACYTRLILQIELINTWVGGNSFSIERVDFTLKPTNRIDDLPARGTVFLQDVPPHAEREYLDGKSLKNGDKDQD